MPLPDLPGSRLYSNTALACHTQLVLTHTVALDSTDSEIEVSPAQQLQLRQLQPCTGAAQLAGTQANLRCCSRAIANHQTFLSAVYMISNACIEPAIITRNSMVWGLLKQGTSQLTSILYVVTCN
jgi:hypothetical protein